MGWRLAPGRLGRKSADEYDLGGRNGAEGWEEGGGTRGRKAAPKPQGVPALLLGMVFGAAEEAGRLEAGRLEADRETALSGIAEADEGAALGAATASMITDGAGSFCGVACDRTAACEGAG